MMLNVTSMVTFHFTKEVRCFLNLLANQGYTDVSSFFLACGVCSTAQDMASFLRHSFPDFKNPTAPTIDTMSFLCQMTVTQMHPNITPKQLVDEVSLCLQHGIQNIVPPAHLTKVSPDDSSMRHQCWLMLTLTLLQ